MIPTRFLKYGQQQKPAKVHPHPPGISFETRGISYYHIYFVEFKGMQEDLS